MHTLGDSDHQSILQIGWQEWCSISKLHLPAIKAKIDTGAKTSAIHAVDIKPFTREGVAHVHFSVYPLQHNTEIKKECSAVVIDQRMIMSSNGSQEERYIIKTNITLGDQTWEIELSLSDRDPLRFRLLLGREALQDRVLISPNKLCCLGKLTAEDINQHYYTGASLKPKDRHTET